MTNSDRPVGSRARASRYKGVYPPTYPGGKWRTFGRVNGRHAHLGFYRTEDEAAKAYDAHVRQLGDPWAVFHFPEPGDAKLIGQLDFAYPMRVAAIVRDRDTRLIVRGGPGRSRCELDLSPAELRQVIELLERAEAALGSDPPSAGEAPAAPPG